jgi:hypothetical protein
MNLGITFHAPKNARKLGNEPSHSKVSSHLKSWSHNGLPNFQRASVRVKTHWIEKFLISLENSWNVNF